MLISFLSACHGCHSSISICGMANFYVGGYNDSIEQHWEDAHDDARAVLDEVEDEKTERLPSESMATVVEGKLR